MIIIVLSVSFAQLSIWSAFDRATPRRLINVLSTLAVARNAKTEELIKSALDCSAIEMCLNNKYLHFNYLLSQLMMHKLQCFKLTMSVYNFQRLLFNAQHSIVNLFCVFFPPICVFIAQTRNQSTMEVATLATLLLSNSTSFAAMPAATMPIAAVPTPITTTTTTTFMPLFVTSLSHRSLHKSGSSHRHHIKDFSPVTLSTEWSSMARLLVLACLSVVGSIGNVFMISSVMIEDHLKKAGK